MMPSSNLVRSDIDAGIIFKYSADPLIFNFEIIELFNGQRYLRKLKFSLKKPYISYNFYFGTVDVRCFLGVATEATQTRFIAWCPNASRYAQSV